MSDDIPSVTSGFTQISCLNATEEQLYSKLPPDVWAAGEARGSDWISQIGLETRCLPSPTPGMNVWLCASESTPLTYTRNGWLVATAVASLTHAVTSTVAMFLQFHKTHVNWVVKPWWALQETWKSKGLIHCFTVRLASTRLLLIWDLGIGQSLLFTTWEYMFQ